MLERGVILKLADVSPERPAFIKVGEYVPFEVEIVAEVRSVDELYYWRCTSAKHLFELKVVSSTGLIGGASLVLAPSKWTRIVQSVAARESQPIQGIPVVDLRPWKEKTGNRELVDPLLRRIDEDIPFQFHIGVDGAGVFFDSGEATSVVRTGDVSFSFARDGSLCAVAITGLAREDLQLLKDAYAH